MFGKRVAAAILALLAPAAARAESTGLLAPEVLLDGRPADGNCRFKARLKPEGKVDPAAAGAELSSEGFAPLDLAPGLYDLRVECGGPPDVLAPPIAPVRVKAGAKTAPKIDIRTTRLRVMAVRDTRRIPAKVMLFARGATGDESPLAIGQANAKFNIAAGDYDLLIEQADQKNAPIPSAWIRGVKIGGEAVVEKQADLSDGKLVIDVSDNGKKAPGAVRVYLKDGKTQVATAEPGETIDLVPARYVVSSTLLDAVDFQTDLQTVWIEPDRTLKRTASFTTGQLGVTVTRDGKPIDAMVYLAKPGAADDFNYFPAPGSVVLAPGKYDVRVEAKGAGPLGPQRQTGVVVLTRQTSKLSFDLTPATLAVMVRKSGKKIDPMDLRVVTAGGGEEAAAPESDGTFRLWPGRYEIIATLPNGEKLRDGPFEVKLKDKLTRAIDYARGALLVIASRGPAQVVEAEVSVYKPGAKAALAKGRVSAQIELLPGTYDVKVVAGVDEVWSEGVKIADGKTTSVKVAFAAAAADPKAPIPEGDPGELPEGDAAPE